MRDHIAAVERRRVHVASNKAHRLFFGEGPQIARGEAMARTDHPRKAYANHAGETGVRRYPWDREFDLWFVQIFLSMFYCLTGAMKTFLTPAALVPMGLADATEIPYWLLRLMGRAELLGAIMILVPPLSRAVAFLAPLAAAELASLQLLTVGLQGLRGDFAFAWALNLALVAFSFFVLWGRAIQASPRRTRSPPRLEQRTSVRTAFPLH